MRSPAAPLAFVLLLAAASPAAAQDAPPPAQRPVYGPAAPVPMWWAPPPQPLVTERRSSGMMITGIVLWAAGGVVTGVGAGLTMYEGLSQCVYADIAPASPRTAARRERIGTARQALDSCGGDLPLASGVLAAGILTSLAGIPLFLIGNSRVRAKPLTGALTLPELKVGAGNAALTWRF